MDIGLSSTGKAQEESAKVNPAPSASPLPAGSLWSKVDDTLQRIAYKVARDEFGLSHGDFIIRYFPWKRHAYKINRLGSVVRVYFGIFPLEKEFEFYLHRALAAVAYAVSSKGGKLEVYGALDATRAHLKKVAPHWDQLPKLVPREELEITEVYKVVVKHKPSGVVIVKEAKHPKFGPMIIDARIEMAEMVEAVNKLEQEKSKLP